MDNFVKLSRRERQIMDIIFTRGKATATQVLEAMPDPPTRTAVRTFLRILEGKGHLKHTKQGREYLYRPIRQRKRAGVSALRRVLNTFFDGSLESALSAHLVDSKSDISADELKRLSQLIAQSRKKGK